MVWVSFSIRSHLLIITTALFHSSRIYPATWVSWDFMPSKASTTSNATSARSMAFMALSTLNFSTPGSMLPLFRMPAVSIIVIGISLYTRWVSIESLVVPGMLLTITRSSPIIWFSRLDFPTLGLPTMAIFMEVSWTSSPPSGRTATRASSISPVWAPWMAETICRVLKPNS